MTTGQEKRLCLRIALKLIMPLRVIAQKVNKNAVFALIMVDLIGLAADDNCLKKQMSHRIVDTYGCLSRFYQSNQLSAV